jgi:cell division septation protein DedD
LKAGAAALCAVLVLAVISADPALAARKKKRKGSARRAVAAAPARPSPPPPSVRQGVEYWRAGKWDDAVKMWSGFAEQGDADAMFNIGQAYKLGRGVALDKMMARDWYRRAAVKGHLPSQANLGILLFQATEKAEAVRWLKAAADKGEMRAQYVLGIIHWNGDGAPKSMPLAYAYLVRAAAQGLPEATRALNELSQVIQPLDRANGWQIATALGNGNGVPPQFQPGIAPPPLTPVNDPLPPVVLASAGEQSPTVAVPGTSAPATSTAALNAAALNAAGGRLAQANADQLRRTEAGGSQPAEAAMGSAPPDAEPAAPAPEPAAPVRVAAKPEPRAKPEPKAKPKPEPEVRETGWRIQLGTYPNQKTAQAAWNKLAAANKRDTKGLRPVIGRFGGSWRLQVGPFDTRDAARAGCGKLEIGKNGCFAIDIG